CQANPDAFSTLRDATVSSAHTVARARPKTARHAALYTCDLRVYLTSWNVLADAYVRAAFYPRSDRALLRRGARTQAILDAIAAGPAELYCLQEVERALVDAARARFADWQIHYEPKRGKPDGCAMFARPGTKLEAIAAIAYDDGSGHIALLATVAGIRIA